MKNFIKTKDSDTAKILFAEGFTLLDESNGIYTFINKEVKDTTKINYDEKKVAFTNIACL